jgi:tetratricopeptide (TPR) repeat protein
MAGPRRSAAEIDPFTERSFLWLRRLAAVVLLVSVFAPISLGDEIYLKNGHKITGSVVREDSRRVIYDQGEGEYALPRSLIDRVVRSPSGVVTARSASRVPLTHDEEAPLPVIQPLDIAGEATLQVIKNGSLDEAQLQRLDEDVLRNPTDENRFRLALGYRVAGAFLAHAGKPDRAIDLYRRALNFAPNDLGLTVALGYLLVTEKEYSQSVDLLIPAGDRFPQSADVPLLLGSAYYYTEDLDRAIAEWKRSLVIHRDPRVQEALAKAEREREVAASYQEMRDEHFLLRYQGADVKPLADQVLQTLDADFDSLQSDLDVYPRELIIVLLYPNQAFSDITRLPSWVGAENDGKIRIPVSGLSSVTPDLARVLKHELTHSFVHQATLGRCPVWFNEGLAQLEEDSPPPASGALLARALSNGQSLPFDSLETSFLDLPKDQVGMAYFKSLVAVQYLRDTYGIEEIRRLLKFVATQPDFSALLQSELRLDYPSLERNVANYAVKRYGP